MPCPIDSCLTHLQRVERPERGTLTQLQHGVSLHLRTVHSYPTSEADDRAREWCE